MVKSKLAYISFDTVPAPKGAATHIAAFSQALATAFGEVQLVTVSPTAETISGEIYPQVMQVMLPAVGDTLIHRVLSFRRLLMKWLQEKRFAVVHIRSIYEGLEIAQNKNQYCDRLIFEVNGLPSIELKYRYRAVADDRELLHKLYTQEQICLEAADLIITPSNVTKEHLQARNIPSEKIRVIPNGVDLNIFTYSSKITQSNHPFHLLYFGTLSSWQGVNLAVEALELINRELPACLTVIGQGRDHQIKALKQLASKLEITDRLSIVDAMSQKELVEYIHTANVILAPLTLSDRNLVQGCCPLKILEGMATGVPIIASNIPVVRELGLNEVHFLLVKPGSAKAIQEAVFRLYQDQNLATELAVNARQQIEQHYTWKSAGEALIKVYQELAVKRLITL